MGDAATLQGGTLLQAPLRAGNGEIYAVAQGPISVGGFSAGSSGGSVSKNHTTVGRVPRGAIVEKATKTDITVNDDLVFSLNDQDFTTASRVADAINDKYGAGTAAATDAGNVTIKVPVDERPHIVNMISEIGDITIEPDASAKVVVDERTGTVAIGGSVRISPVAISHGNLSVEINKDFLVSQPPPVSTGKTVAVPLKKVTANEDRASLVTLRGGSTIDDLVKALNALKVTPRDTIAILQAIKQAGALHGELEVL
jgi:flagellar P-ring protein precursor FlgI